MSSSSGHPTGGREERFEALWAEYYGTVYRYCRRRVSTEDAARDVTADTFLVAWRRIDQIREPARAWLLAVARNIGRNHRRAEARRLALTARVNATQDRSQTEVPEPGDARLAEAFARLSDADREVLALIAWDELKPREAAEVLGISPARLSVRLHRARKRLREHLEDLTDESSDAPGAPTVSDRAPLVRMEMQ
ncbi:MAG: RNA polymerase sigma factor [Solirubrobacterales bacterium]